MGCDIHCYCEIKRDGKWTHSGSIFPYTYFREDRPSDVKNCWNPGDEEYHDNYHPSRGEPCNSNCYVANPKLVDEPYHRCNYDLFAMLANVRNGRGFAGVITGEGFNPIAMPKGIPADICPELLAKYTLTVKDGGETPGTIERWIKSGSSVWIDREKGVFSHPDLHSASWFTVAELEAYNWDQATGHQGYVDLENYKIFKEKGKPESWSGGVGGDRVKIRSNKEMDQIIARGGGKVDWDDPDSKHYYTQVSWREPYRVSAREFLNVTMPRLRELGAPEDVRIVFWFDN